MITARILSGWVTSMYLLALVPTIAAQTASTGIAGFSQGNYPPNGALRLFQTIGPMSTQAQGLSEVEKRGIAEVLGGRPPGIGEAGDAKSMSNRCSSDPPLTDPSAGPAWNGWGVDAANTRFQSEKVAGITAAQVPSLKLKWAFGCSLGVITATFTL